MLLGCCIHSLNGGHAVLQVPSAPTRVANMRCNKGRGWGKSYSPSLCNLSFLALPFLFLAVRPFIVFWPPFYMLLFPKPTATVSAKHVLCTTTRWRRERHNLLQREVNPSNLSLTWTPRCTIKAAHRTGKMAAGRFFFFFFCQWPLKVLQQTNPMGCVSACSDWLSCL